MAGYYFISAPSQTVQKHETVYSVNRADMRSVVECASSAHNAVIKDIEFNNICTEKYDIKTQLICLDDSFNVTECGFDKIKKTKYNFIVVSTGVLPDSEYNNTLEILEEYYPSASTFGVFMSGFIVSGKNGKRVINENVIKSAGLINGQLVYITQFDIPDIETDYINSDTSDIECGLGTIKTYRFSRWQCIPQNQKTNCPGDTIWDYDVQECISDESRKPLCTSNQTAVIVDDVWQCIDPVSERTCPVGQTAKLNYSTLEWICVYDPDSIKTTKRCDTLNNNIVYGKIGATLQISYNSCTDCEKIIIDSETCSTICMPDTGKLGNSGCYADTSNCSGLHKAFYFGFPTATYALNVPAVSGYNITFDSNHSQNRMFNCLDCGDGEIDTENSYPPYTAVCK